MFTEEEKEKLEKMNELFNEIEDIYNTLEQSTQEKIFEFQRADTSIPHCIRWGITGTEELLEESEKKYAQVLIFTTVDKGGYTSDAVTTNEKGETRLSDSMKEEIESEYGFSKEKLAEAWLYGSEAMNGDDLYFHIASDNQHALNEIERKLINANLRLRSDLDEWIENQNDIKVLESEGCIDAWDQYLIQVEV